MAEEIVIAILIFGTILLVLLAGPILAIIALVRSGRVRVLQQQVDALSREVQRLSRQVASGPGPVAPQGPPGAPAGGPSEAEAVEIVPVELVAEVVPETTAATSGLAAAGAIPLEASPAFSLEMFIGRKALGWVAVVVLLFGTGFFLRYAYENQWIGPLGRVMIGLAGGVALVTAGWRYDRQGWHLFSRMLTAAGVLVLYLSTYSAFGFYHLVPQRWAGLLLVIVVAESAMLAVVYDAWGVALMAVVGGLFTPILLMSDHDQYESLFTYLAVLNAGTLALLVRRAWHGIGTVALVGTQGLFWMWYEANYHPEKLAWAAGFQIVIYALHWSHAVASSAWRKQVSTVEEIVRSSLCSMILFGSLYVLFSPEHRPWLGTIAVAMAAVESLGARIMLMRAETPALRRLTAVAIAVGFITLAFPLQADAHWVAAGWAAQAVTLAWFGLRIESLPLRLMALALAILATVRIVVFNAPWAGRVPFWPIWNSFAAPSLLVVLLFAAGLVLSRKMLERTTIGSRIVAGLVVVVCVGLTWFVMSFDVYQYCRSLEQTSTLDYDWRRIAQMSLSTTWALFATGVLAAGFRSGLSVLRWSALGLYAVTVAKVFTVDMAGLDQIYRIVAFLLLAVVLGGAAWAYQRKT